MTERNSRLTGFYKQSLAERQATVAAWAGLTADQQAALTGDDSLTLAQAEHMIENVVGLYSLPLGIATNFRVNGRDVLVPMVVEEPSIVAGASFMARLTRDLGGFTTGSTEPEMIGQLQVLDVPDLPSAATALLERKNHLLTAADAANPGLKQRGGGARDLDVHLIDDSPIGPFMVVHLILDTRDAMGANAINTACEAIAPAVEQITGGRVHLRILSNLTDRRRAWARCAIPTSALAFDDFSGEDVRDRIIAAWAFAAADPYRAATHNKGIMNGIDAVVLATGNDWRAVEAGAHAYAARDGRYTSLSRWGSDDHGNLVGEIDLPLAVGIVGGATRVHPTAQAALAVLGVTTARELAEIMAAVGLAQNLAALRALATEGIQRGHMSLHARQVALAAGAAPDQVPAIAEQLIRENAIRLSRAQELIALLAAGKPT